MLTVLHLSQLLADCQLLLTNRQLPLSQLTTELMLAYQQLRLVHALIINSPAHQLIEMLVRQACQLSQLNFHQLRKAAIQASQTGQAEQDLANFLFGCIQDCQPSLDPTDNQQYCYQLCLINQASADLTIGSLTTMSSWLVRQADSYYLLLLNPAKVTLLTSLQDPDYSLAEQADLLPTSVLTELAQQGFTSLTLTRQGKNKHLRLVDEADWSDLTDISWLSKGGGNKEVRVESSTINYWWLGLGLVLLIIIAWLVLRR